MKSRRILVVADESLSSSLRKTLENRGFVVAVAIAGDDVLQKLLASQVDLIVVDLDAGRGTDFIGHVRKIVRLNGTPIMALGCWGTGQPTLALSSGADAYEPTPISETRLADAVERILNRRAAIVGMQR